MGSGASSALQKEEDNVEEGEDNNNDDDDNGITEDDLKGYCISYSSDQFISETVYQSSILYQSLANITGNGLISHSTWNIILQSSPEQESLKLFLQYCSPSSSSPFNTSSTSPRYSTSLMNLEQYIEYCKLLKLLSKRYYTKQAAINSFQQYSWCPPSTPSSTRYINYYIFRFQLLLFISKLKLITIDNLIIRFSRIEPDILQPITPSTKESQEQVEITNQILYNAACHIQKFSRYHLAKLFTEKLKKLSLENYYHDDDMDTSRSREREKEGKEKEQEEEVKNKKNYLLKLEEKCYNIYIKYCNIPEEMNVYDFLKLCHDTALIPYGNEKIDLTKREAKYIFQCCINKYYNKENNNYLHGVIHGKRIIYHVYRYTLLPAIAEWKHITIEDILKIVSIDMSNHARRIYTNTHGPEIISMLSPSYLDQEILQKSNDM